MTERKPINFSKFATEKRGGVPGSSVMVHEAVIVDIEKRGLIPPDPNWELDGEPSNLPRLPAPPETPLLDAHDLLTSVQLLHEKGDTIRFPTWEELVAEEKAIKALRENPGK